MKKIILSIFVLLTTTLLAAETLSSSFTPKALLSVYDGDTFKVDLKCTTTVFCKNISIRVNGIDTPEIRTASSIEKALGYEAKSLSSSILNSAENIKLNNCVRGKYFRLVCDVSADGVDLATELIKSGLAVEYYGGTKTKDWGK